MRCPLSRGRRANNCIAKITITKACQAVGSLDAKQTDAKIEALNEADLDTLEEKPSEIVLATGAPLQLFI